MKRKSRGKKILITVICLVLVCAIGGGVWFVTNRQGGEPVNVFPFNYVGMTEYWGDSQESYGNVQTDGVQTVYLSGTQTVTEILVQQGDEVKKGDVLMTFDTTLSDLALERKRLEVEKLKLQLEDAKKRLAEINAMRPMVIPQPDEAPEEDEDLGEKLTAAYFISEDTDYDGSSAELALICWLNSATAVDDALLEELRLKAEEYQTVNAEKAPQEEPTDPENPEEEPTEPSEPSEPTEPEEIHVEKFYVVFKVTEGNRELASRTTWEGIYAILGADGSYSFKFFNADILPDHTLAPDEEAEEGPEIDFGSGFTAAQIAEMRAQQEKAIRDLEFNIKMAEADYKIAQTEASDGNVYAQIDGIVVSVLDPDEAQMMMQPVIKVSAGGGFYVEGTVSELDRDNMVIGQEVTIMDWNTGMSYVGYVESLGDYPSADGYWNGMGNPTATYYPFRVFVDESADLQSGSFVSIQFSPGTTEHGVYLENPFIRTEGGRSYVYVMGEDGKLEQRFVTTGKSLWGSYTEILEGLTEEDFVAFPYGKNVKPGAEAVEGDLSALYG